MSVNGIGTLSSAPVSNLSAMSGALTPDALMEYCQTQLSGMDSSVNTLMTEQNKSAHASSSLSSVATQLQNYSDGFQTTGMDPGSSKGKDIISAQVSADLNTSVTSSLQDALDNTTDASDKAQIQTLLTNWTNTMGDGNVAASEVSSMLAGIKNVQNDMSTNQSMAMIQIQSLVSQRGQAIQMTSSMVQALNDSTKGVIANINQ